MRTIASLAATAILLCTSASLALAQNAPDSGAPATSSAPAAPAAPAASPAPESTPAPAPSPQSANPPAASTPAATPAPATADKDLPKAAKTKKKKLISSSQRREIDRSIDSGTVPSRYRNQVPKEYQQYIPFSKD